MQPDDNEHVLLRNGCRKPRYCSVFSVMGLLLCFFTPRDSYCSDVEVDHASKVSAVLEENSKSSTCMP